jgi:Flp pilus assembly protein TadD
MSRPLNMADGLLAHAQNLLRFGRRAEAFAAFSRLAALPGLPAKTAAEANRQLAVIHLDRRHFRKARKALTAALACETENADCHHLLALACDRDPRGNPRRALRHYRRAVELEPENAGWRCDLGHLALRLDRTEEAVAELRKAAKLAPDAPDVLESVTDGLADAGRPNEARSLLRAARFRHRRDRRFEGLWNRFQFLELRARQMRRPALPILRPVSAVPDVIPFDRGDRPENPVPVAGGIVRFDLAARPAPHLARRHARRDP